MLTAPLLEVNLLALRRAEPGAAGASIDALLLVVLGAELAQLAIVRLLGKRDARVHV